jgi:membrane-associated phospholipid phosphatase
MLKLSDPATSAPTSGDFHFRGTWKSAATATAVLALLAAAAVPTVDGPLAVASMHTDLPHFVFTMIIHSEVFGDGCGVLFFFVAVWLLDPARRRCLPRLIACAYGSGLAVNVVKLFIARARPFYWLEQQGGKGLPSFGEWLPLGSNGTAWQSFPSGHTATAVGLALGLAALYPRGRVLFLAMAVLVGCQRVVNDMHYVADVLAAAIVAIWTTTAIFRSRTIARRFEKFEAKGRAAAVEEAPRRLAA